MELDEQVKKLVAVQNTVYAWRQKYYDNPTVKPGYTRLTEAIRLLSQAIDLIKEPMG